MDSKNLLRYINELEFDKSVFQGRLLKVHDILQKVETFIGDDDDEYYPLPSRQSSLNFLEKTTPCHLLKNESEFSPAFACTVCCCTGVIPLIVEQIIKTFQEKEKLWLSKVIFEIQKRVKQNIINDQMKASIKEIEKLLVALMLDRLNALDPDEKFGDNHDVRMNWRGFEVTSKLHVDCEDDELIDMLVQQFKYEELVKLMEYEDYWVEEIGDEDGLWRTRILHLENMLLKYHTSEKKLIGSLVVDRQKWYDIANNIATEGSFCNRPSEEDEHDGDDNRIMKAKLKLERKERFELEKKIMKLESDHQKLVDKMIHLQKNEKAGTQEVNVIRSKSSLAHNTKSNEINFNSLESPGVSLGEGDASKKSKRDVIEPIHNSNMKKSTFLAYIEDFMGSDVDDLTVIAEFDDENLSSDWEEKSVNENEMDAIQKLNKIHEIVGIQTELSLADKSHDNSLFDDETNSSSRLIFTSNSGDDYIIKEEYNVDVLDRKQSVSDLQKPNSDNMEKGNTNFGVPDMDIGSVDGANNPIWKDDIDPISGDFPEVNIELISTTEDEPSEMQEGESETLPSDMVDNESEVDLSELLEGEYETLPSAMVDNESEVDPTEMQAGEYETLPSDMVDNESEVDPTEMQDGEYETLPSDMVDNESEFDPTEMQDGKSEILPSDMVDNVIEDDSTEIQDDESEILPSDMVDNELEVEPSEKQNIGFVRADDDGRILEELSMIQESNKDSADLTENDFQMISKQEIESSDLEDDRAIKPGDFREQNKEVISKPEYEFDEIRDISDITSVDFENTNNEVVLKSELESKMNQELDDLKSLDFQEIPTGDIISQSEFETHGHEIPEFVEVNCGDFQEIISEIISKPESESGEKGTQESKDLQETNSEVISKSEFDSQENKTEKIGDFQETEGKIIPEVEFGSYEVHKFSDIKSFDYQELNRNEISNPELESPLEFYESIDLPETNSELPPCTPPPLPQTLPPYQLFYNKSTSDLSAFLNTDIHHDSAVDEVDETNSKDEIHADHEDDIISQLQETNKQISEKLLELEDQLEIEIKKKRLIDEENTNLCHEKEQLQRKLELKELDFDRLKLDFDQLKDNNATTQTFTDCSASLINCATQTPSDQEETVNAVVLLSAKLDSKEKELGAKVNEVDRLVQEMRDLHQRLRDVEDEKMKSIFLIEKLQLDVKMTKIEAEEMKSLKEAKVGLEIALTKQTDQLRIIESELTEKRNFESQLHKLEEEIKEKVKVESEMIKELSGVMHENESLKETALSQKETEENLRKLKLKYEDLAMLASKVQLAIAPLKAKISRFGQKCVKKDELLQHLLSELLCAGVDVDEQLRARVATESYSDNYDRTLSPLTITHLDRLEHELLNTLAGNESEHRIENLMHPRTDSLFTRNSRVYFEEHNGHDSFDSFVYTRKLSASDGNIKDSKSFLESMMKTRNTLPEYRDYRSMISLQPVTLMNSDETLRKNDEMKLQSQPEHDDPHWKSDFRNRYFESDDSFEHFLRPPEEYNIESEKSSDDFPTYFELDKILNEHRPQKIKEEKVQRKQKHNHSLPPMAAERPQQRKHPNVEAFQQNVNIQQPANVPVHSNLTNGKLKNTNFSKQSNPKRSHNSSRLTRNVLTSADTNRPVKQITKDEAVTSDPTDDVSTDRPPPPSNFCIRKIMGRRKFLLSWECFDAEDSNPKSKIEGYQMFINGKRAEFISGAHANQALIELVNLNHFPQTFSVSSVSENGRMSSPVDIILERPESTVEFPEEHGQRTRRAAKPDHHVHLSSSSSSLISSLTPGSKENPKMFLAVYDFTASNFAGTSDNRELAFHTGDIIVTYGPVQPDGYYVGKILGTSQCGLVPASFIEEIKLIKSGAPKK